MLILCSYSYELIAATGNTLIEGTPIEFRRMSNSPPLIVRFDTLARSIATNISVTIRVRTASGHYSPITFTHLIRIEPQSETEKSHSKSIPLPPALCLLGSLASALLTAYGILYIIKRRRAIDPVIGQSQSISEAAATMPQAIAWQRDDTDCLISDE